MAVKTGLPQPEHLPYEEMSSTIASIPSYLGYIIASPTAPATWTLPDLSTPTSNVAQGALLQIKNTSTFPITLLTTDSIDGAPSYLLAPDRTLSLVSGPEWKVMSDIAGPSSTIDLIDADTFIVDLADPTKRLGFDITGSPATTTTFVTAPTVDRQFITPDISGTALVSETTTGMVYVNATAPLHGSNSGIQYSTTFSSRAQLRCNQYGNATGVPGISTFKSRGATIGSLAPVQVGDVIYRDTAVGVTDNLSIPLSAFISINVSSVPAGQGYISTDYELQLVSVDGPANGRRPVYKLDSEGRIHLLESTSPGPHTTVPSGVVTLGAGATIVVANSKLPANARILLTVQPGPAPLGTVWVSAITANTSFTISSTNVLDVGVNVYYQVYVPL